MRIHDGGFRHEGLTLQINAEVAFLVFGYLLFTDIDQQVQSWMRGEKSSKTHTTPDIHYESINHFQTRKQSPYSNS